MPKIKNIKLIAAFDLWYKISKTEIPTTEKSPKAIFLAV